MASNDVLPRGVVSAEKVLARAPMALGKSKIGKGKLDPKAPQKWKKPSLGFKRHPGGDNVIINGPLIPDNGKLSSRLRENPPVDLNSETPAISVVHNGRFSCSIGTSPQSYHLASSVGGYVSWRW